MSAYRKEAPILLISFFSTLLLDLKFTILLGVILSLMIYLRKMSKSKLQQKCQIVKPLEVNLSQALH